MRTEVWECSCLKAVLRASGSPQRRKSKQIMAADSQYSTLIGGGCPGERYMSLSRRQQEFDIYKYRGPFAFESHAPAWEVGAGSGRARTAQSPAGTRDLPRARSAPRGFPADSPRIPRRFPAARPAPSGASGPPGARLPWDRDRPRGRGGSAPAPAPRPPPPPSRSRGSLILTAFSFFSPRKQAAEIAGEAPPPPRRGSRLCCAEPGTGEGAAKWMVNCL